MILAYIDESGTNFSQDKNKYFDTDGPYIIWSCVLISEKKYLDIERTFQDLAKKFLEPKFYKKELHANEIWNSRKTSKQPEKIKQYFEELIQFAGKLHIPVLFGIQQKNPNFRKNNKLGKIKQFEQARYSLLTILEHRLAEINETAVLVADKEGTAKEEMKNLVFQRTEWRYDPPITKERGIVKPKYLFEFRSHSILDQLHYVDSKESLLMQFSDHICYVLRKSLEHLYLLHFPQPGKRPVSNKDLVPISSGTFEIFINFCQVMYGYYNDKTNDVNLGLLTSPYHVTFTFEKPIHTVQIVGGIDPSLQLLQQFTPYG